MPDDVLRPLVAVLGPTASGKSHLAIRIAQCYQAEIINCDSLQIYRGLDIGTAKPSRAERKAIPHHLIDILEPWQLCNAGEFARMAEDSIREIALRGKLPILAGGTGFYFRALVDGLSPGPKRDEDLRRRLLRREEDTSGSLHRLLQRFDPGSARRIHSSDLNKTVRALEICILARLPASALFSRQALRRLEGFRVLRLVLEPERTALRQRIAARSRQMFASGLIEEVRGLLNSGLRKDAKAFESIGYRQAIEVIQGRMEIAQAIERTTIATSQYAKRQVTWFRREAQSSRLSGFGDNPAVVEEALRLVSSFLESLQIQSTTR